MGAGKPQLLENRAFLAAYRKDRAAATARQSPVNPYHDKRNRSSRVTFSAAFRNYWFEGYDDAQAGLPERYRPLNAADAQP